MLLAACYYLTIRLESDMTKKAKFVKRSREEAKALHSGTFYRPQSINSRKLYTRKDKSWKE